MDDGSIVVDAQQRRRSEDYRDFYANNCTGRISPFDISLIFAQAKEIPGAGVLNEEMATVTFSPQQFKLLATLCTNVAAAYEQTFGEIKLPPEVANPRMSIGDIVAAVGRNQAAVLARRAEIQAHEDGATDAEIQLPSSKPSTSPTVRHRAPKRRLHIPKKKS